jgi:tRNA(fMet)-specific endonuclease VapC
VKILDSDHCDAILRGQLNPLDHTQPDDELAITAIGVGELTHGAHRSTRPADNLARVDVLIAALTVLPFDESSGRVFGEIKARLEQAGTPLDDLDLQIASIALANNLILVTHNQRHFGRVPNLALEDWLK